ARPRSGRGHRGENRHAVRRPGVAIRVALVEDQAMVRGAFGGLLDLEPDIEVVEVAEDGEQGLEAVARHWPDIVITDIEMPRMTGPELAVALEGDPEVVVVILTT